MRRFAVSILLFACVGVALAQEDGVSRFAESLARVSDQRNPDRIVSRAFDSILNARMSVTGSLTELIDQDLDGAQRMLNAALQEANDALNEIRLLRDVATVDDFEPLILFRRGVPVVLTDFSQTMWFMQEETEALVNSIEQLLERSFTDDGLQQIRFQAQALENYTAAYFGLAPPLNVFE